MTSYNFNTAREEKFLRNLERYDCIYPSYTMEEKVEGELQSLYHITFAILSEMKTMDGISAPTMAAVQTVTYLNEQERNEVYNNIITLLDGE